MYLSCASDTQPCYAVSANAVARIHCTTLDTYLAMYASVRCARKAHTIPERLLLLAFCITNSCIMYTTTVCDVNHTAA